MTDNNGLDQTEAVIKAADAGGAFLDKLGKTDLATLSYDEWMSFVNEICVVYDWNIIPF